MINQRLLLAGCSIAAFTAGGHRVCAETFDKICDSRPPCTAAAYTSVPSATLTDLPGGAELLAREHQLYVGLLEFRVKDTALDAGVDYQYTRYEYKNVGSRNRDLHRLQLPVRFESHLNGWTLQGYGAPSISTSSNVFKDYFNHGNSDDVYFTGRLNGRWSPGDRSWFFGIAHDRRFGKPRAYPVAGMEFSPLAHLSLRIAFPDPEMRVLMSDRNTLQARLFPAGHQWSVATDDLTRRFNYRVETWRAQVIWNYRVWRPLSVDISVGYDFRREHRFQNDVGQPLNSAVANQWLLGIGFRLGTAVLPVTHGGHH